jgi:NDP-sugar pyrophosphorylase family protein
MLEQNQTKIFAFKEKPKGDEARINGGFFVLEPGVSCGVSGRRRYASPIIRIFSDL